MKPARWPLLGSLAVLGSASISAQSDFHDNAADLAALPSVPAGFQVSLFAREPLVRQPCSMAFDRRGRLFVGMGPQYRNPTPDTPGDSVVRVLDADGDGTADTTKVFATGFNCVQGLAWHGDDLWVANAPDLTVVRDLDGDDVADEYVRVFTDLGNLEHGLHGLNWAPDGRLYMSKGNSKGLNLPERHAPKPFRDLWGVPTPPGGSDFPAPQTFTRDTYRHAYHDPADDWGREGGILRCEPGGTALEVVARGFRNPWDIGFDDGFDWLGTDNDQNEGDRVFAPFYGAHFGWNHAWDAGWTGVNEPQIAPVCGPIFQGSGTGVVFGASPTFPEAFQNVWFINDWLRKTTFVFRPHWNGATLEPMGGQWEPFISGGRSLFRPVDIAFGPDGALWCLGWSRGYGAEYANNQLTNEGRIYRVSPTSTSSQPGPPSTEERAPAALTVSELVGAFENPLPAWRTAVQRELWSRRGEARAELEASLASGRQSRASQTWTAWTLGRLAPADRSLDARFAAHLSDPGASLNLRLQALRILADRAAARSEHEAPAAVLVQLQSSEPRLRHEAVLALARLRATHALPDLIQQLSVENDRTVVYSGWQTLRLLAPASRLRELVAASPARVRSAALLALLEEGTTDRETVEPLAEDHDPKVRAIATAWLTATSVGSHQPVIRGRPLTADSPEGAPAGQTDSNGTPAPVVTGVIAQSPHPYKLVPGGLKAGTHAFTDRNYRLKSIPDALQGCDFIRTANEDDPSHGDAFLTFNALLPVRVHVAHDTRHRSRPAWLSRGWSEGDVIKADHWTYQLLHREFPAGPVSLGGNTDDGDALGHSQYMVVIEALPLPPPQHPATLEQVRSLLPRANAARGGAVFQQRGGAGCSACHRMNGHGNAFGPDLAGLAARAEVSHLIESILNPSAVITEGFNLTVVDTAEGSVSGVLLEESGVSLTLGLPTGQQRLIPKSAITARQSPPVSAMPPYASVLGASDIADIVAWLLAQPAQPDESPAPATTPGRTTEPQGTPSPDASAAKTDWPSGPGFHVTTKDDRFIIAHDGDPVAHFIFRDSRIRRPYFAHAHAPGRIQVTRTHPPLDGVDPTDHADMHPGLWLGFGDISGHDFWRNKAAMNHEHIVDPPAVLDGRLRFSTLGSLAAPNGEIIGRVLHRIAVSRQPDAYLLTWVAVVEAAGSDLVFGDQEEMGFGARVATPLSEVNGGRLTSSTGRTSAKATWGQPADWCDYSGVLNGRACGITLMASPSNFRTAWWHNRDYGVFVSNPFGRASMKQGDPSALAVRQGSPLTLRFGAALHASPNSSPTRPDQFFASWMKEPQP